MSDELINARNDHDNFVNALKVLAEVTHAIEEEQMGVAGNSSIDLPYPVLSNSGHPIHLPHGRLLLESSAEQPNSSTMNIEWSESPREFNSGMIKFMGGISAGITGGFLGLYSQLDNPDNKTVLFTCAAASISLGLVAVKRGCKQIAQSVNTFSANNESLQDFK
jgi:hypothetical protein